MKILYTIFLILSLLYTNAEANQSPTASQISTNTSGFNKNLNSGDTTQQLVDNAVDQLNVITASPHQCNAGNYPLGIDTAGNAQSCTPVTAGTVTSVTASSPLASSGGSTPNISVSSSTGTGAVVLQNSPNLTANVGIGSASPGQALDVQGTVRTTNFTMSGQTPQNGYVLTATDSSGDSTWKAGTGTGTVTSVGLSTPHSTLTLGGTNPVTTSGTINADINLTNANTWTGQQIFNTANVGIGSVNPGQALDVNGTVRATGFQLTTSPTAGYVLTSSSVGIGTWQPAASGGSVANPTATIGLTAINGSATSAIRSDGAPALSQSIAPTWTGTHTFNGSPIAAVFGGNVGIGSVNPGQMLDVQGNIRINGSSPRLQINGTSTPGFEFYNSGIRGWLVYPDVTSNAFIWKTNTNLRMSLLQSGNMALGGNITDDGVDINGATMNITGSNVGIGSTNPGQALDVQGTIRAISGGTCITLYRCQGGTDAGIIQTVACTLCPTSTCVPMHGCF